MDEGEKRNLRREIAVWVEERIAKGKQPNGYISNINWQQQLVSVYFHDHDPGCNFKQLKGGDYQTFSWDDFEGNFTEKFGGAWHIYGDTSAYEYPSWWKGVNPNDL